ARLKAPDGGSRRGKEAEFSGELALLFRLLTSAATFYLLCAGSFHHRAQDDVSIVHAGVIALEINGAGAEFIRPKRAARAAEHGLVVDGLLAVVNNRQVAVHQRDVEGLPFAGQFGDVFTRHDPAVESATIVRVIPF